MEKPEKWDLSPVLVGSVESDEAGGSDGTPEPVVSIDPAGPVDSAGLAGGFGSAEPAAPGGPAAGIVSIRDLSVRFADKAVLSGVNLTARTGQITIIVGPSGSGKSTLLRTINRLNEFFPDCRTEGIVELTLDGEDGQHGSPGDIYKNFLPLPELRRKVGMVFQTPGVLPFSVWKNLAMPLEVTLGLKSRALLEHIERALREVALWDEVKDRLHAGASTLSGGQQQRLCLARALALQPRILLLDEPTASLDFRATRKIEELLTRLKERYTIIAVSHSMSQTRRLADRVCVLREGRVLQELDRRLIEDRDVFQKLIEDVF